MICEPFWPSVRAKVDKIREHIQNHQALMTEVVALEDTVRAQKAIDMALTEYDRAQKFRDHQAFCAIRDEIADFTDFRVVHGTHTDSGYASACNPLCRGSAGGELNTSKLVTTAEADESDARTVYSEEGSLGSIELDTYKSDLVSDLVNKMSQFKAKPEELEKGFDALPQLLQSFALRLGQSGSSKAERDVMYFVHKHRMSVKS